MSLYAQKLTTIACTGNYIQQSLRRSRWHGRSSLFSYHAGNISLLEIACSDSTCLYPRCTLFIARYSSLSFLKFPSKPYSQTSTTINYLEHEKPVEDEGSRDEETNELMQHLNAFPISLVLNILLGNVSLLELTRLAISTLKRRKMKMNKHKLSKRRKLLRAKRDSRK